MDHNQQVLQLLAQSYNLTNIFMEPLRSFSDINLHVSCDQGEYVAKLFNASSEVTDDFLHEQFRVMRFLHSKGYHCSCALQDVSGSYINQLDILESKDGLEVGCYRVVLLSYIQGSELVTHAPLSAPLLHLSGSLVAGLRADMRNFPSSTTTWVPAGNHSWSLENFTGLREHLHIIQDKSDRKLVNDVITAFEKSVLPVLDDLEKGIIHGDIHDDNLIILPSMSTFTTDIIKDITGCESISEDTTSEPTASCSTVTSDIMDTQDPKKVLGLIDFGDMNYSRYIFELAIAIAYLTMFSKRKDFLHVGRAVLQGYTSRERLVDREMEVLFVSVCARYCQELVLGQVEAEKQGGNTEYLRCGFKTGWPQLRQLWGMGDEEVMAIWKGIEEDGNGELLCT